MGACLSYDQNERKARARSDEIDRQIYEHGRNDSATIKLLLLGAGESGKSTLVKQMKIIHSGGFSLDELDSFRTAVLDNLVTSMKYVLSGMGLLRINLSEPQNKSYVQIVLSCQRCYDKSQTMLPIVAQALRCLWSDAGVRHAVSRGYEYQLNDSAIYYFENMERICSSKFTPNQVDVLRARIRTNGVIETCFRTKNAVFRVFDVGGQRSERRKWIGCFDDVISVLFVIALSGYDMTLVEDPNVNRLDESLRLFQQICKSPYFSRTSIILFFNKFDLFIDKILHSNRHLKYYYRDFAGPERDVHSAALYIRDLFLVHAYNNVTYTHFTTATDTSNVEVVFNVVMDTIIKDNLEAAQLL